MSVSIDELWEELALEGAPGTGVTSQDPNETLRPRFNIAPTQVAPVVTDREPKKLALLKWGLVPFWAEDVKGGAKLINVRAETIHEKPTFRRIFDERRCLVVADGFYEWKKEKKHKKPMAIRLPERGLMTFAGLWSSWRPKENPDARLVTFTIVTTTPAESVRALHDRMPVILPPESRAAWLDHGVDATTLLEMLRPYEAPLDVYEVSARVGSHVNDDPELLDPVTLSDGPLFD